ncbi:MAG: zf-HC2 domain-containing protein [Nocardioides sp.]
MTCQELVELVTAYLEGALSDDERTAFEEHLALCPGCDRYLEQFRTTIDLVGELPEESLSVSVREDLLGAFGAWRRTRGTDDH